MNNDIHEEIINEHGREGGKSDGKGKTAKRGNP